MITTVLFDFFGTLVRPVVWPDTPITVLARWGYPASAELQQSWRAEAVAGIEHVTASAGRDTYLAWERCRLAKAAKASGVPSADLDRVVDEMFAARAPRVVEPYPDCAEGLAALRERGVVLGVCSNWDWDLGELVADIGLAEQFEVVIASAHAGGRKPHPRFYSYVLDRCGLKADEVLFVGDTIDADVAGPLSAGMHAAFMMRDEPAVWIGLAGEPPSGSGATGSLPPGARLVQDVIGVAALLDVVDGPK